MELLASDLRAVLAAYGEIVGKVDNERMLDQFDAAMRLGAEGTAVPPAGRAAPTPTP